MIEENKRVLLGMSGGTDSSVAAMRLLEAGYEVIGVTFRFYELNGSTEYLEDARSLAEHLGIRHITYDAREVFNKQIIEYFVQEYMAGRTPVPCTLPMKWAYSILPQGITFGKLSWKIPIISHLRLIRTRIRRSFYGD